MHYEYADKDVRPLLVPSLGSPYVVQAHSSCSWTIKSPDSESSVFLAADVVQNVSRDICHQLGCGEPYNLNQSSDGINKTCLTNCVYQDYHLKHCTEITSSDCSLLSELQCGESQTDFFMKRFSMLQSCYILFLQNL